MQPLTDLKVIRHYGPNDVDAIYDGEYLGSFRTRQEAQRALDDHAMRLIEDGLVDLPLTLLNTPVSQYPCLGCGGVLPVGRGGHCDACVEWDDVPPEPDDIPGADPAPGRVDHPSIVRKVIIAWHKERAQCAFWLAAFSEGDRQRLAEAVVAYRRRFYESDLTVDRLLAEWNTAITDLLPPRPAAALRAA